MIFLGNDMETMGKKLEKTPGFLQFRVFFLMVDPFIVASWRGGEMPLVMTNIATEAPFRP